MIGMSIVMVLLPEEMSFLQSARGDAQYDPIPTRNGLQVFRPSMVSYLPLGSYPLLTTAGVLQPIQLVSQFPIFTSLTLSPFIEVYSQAFDCVDSFDIVANVCFCILKGTIGLCLRCEVVTVTIAPESLGFTIEVRVRIGNRQDRANSFIIRPVPSCPSTVFYEGWGRSQSRNGVTRCGVARDVQGSLKPKEEGSRIRLYAIYRWELLSSIPVKVITGIPLSPIGNYQTYIHLLCTTHTYVS